MCAARTGDEVNPEKASSASQFYIVTGKKYSEAELGQMEKYMEGRRKQVIFNRLQTENKSKIMELYRSGFSDVAELAANYTLLQNRIRSAETAGKGKV